MTERDDRADRDEAEVLSGSAESPQVEDVAATSPEDERVARLLTHTIDVPVLAEAVEQQEAADAADTLEHLEDDAAEILVAMEESAAAEALAEMEPPLAASVLEDLLDEDNAEYAGVLLLSMAPDDAVDLLQTVSEEHRERILRVIPYGERALLRRLVLYDEDSAAGLMTTNYLALAAEMTVAEATEAIRARAIPDEMHDLPVVDDDGRLIGLISLRRLLLSGADARAADLIDESVRAIRADLDREDVAREFDRYDLSLLPVVDAEDLLLGVVTVDDIIDIIREEQTEDVQKTVGAGAEEAVYSSTLEKVRGRFRWLLVSLVIMVPSALVITSFEWLIEEMAVLAVVMPVVAALAGNAGHQALAVTLRGIVLDEVRPDRIWPLLRREAATGVLTGTVLGAVVGAIVGALSLVVEGLGWTFGVVIAVSMALSMCVGTLAGAGIPLLMRRLGADPAQSSAIFLIMITDAVAFATFLGLAYLSYQWLAV